jgi:hypothetical protein
MSRDTSIAKASLAHATDVERLAIPTQLGKLRSAIHANLWRVHGLVGSGREDKAVDVIRRYLAPQIGTARALTDRLNALNADGPKPEPEPALATHVRQRVKVARKRYARWADK